MPKQVEKYYKEELGPQEKITSKMRQQLESNLSIDKIKTLEQIKMGHGQLAEAILVLLGLKPTTELAVYDWNENPKEARRKMEEAGLIIKEKKIRSHEHENLTAKFVVTLDERLATELMNAEADEDHEKYGKLMGYPETAVKAFLGETELLPDKDYLDMSGIIFDFKMSKDHYKEEFETLSKWSEAIKKYAPSIYAELSEQNK